MPTPSSILTVHRLTFNSVVAILIRRLVITLNPATAADFVFGLYKIGLVSFLEIWLSMIIVSLPALAPLFRHYIEPLYSHKRPTHGNLREAQHTIGSEPRRRRTDYMCSDVEMGSSNYSAQVKTGMSSSQTDGEEKVEFVKDIQPNAIAMRRDVVVQESRDSSSNFV